MTRSKHCCTHVVVTTHPNHTTPRQELGEEYTRRLAEVDGSKTAREAVAKLKRAMARLQGGPVRGVARAGRAAAGPNGGRGAVRVGRGARGRLVM
jgi:hypothetical protein